MNLFTPSNFYLPTHRTIQIIVTISKFKITNQWAWDYTSIDILEAVTLVGLVSSRWNLVFISWSYSLPDTQPSEPLDGTGTTNHQSQSNICLSDRDLVGVLAGALSITISMTNNLRICSTYSNAPSSCGQWNICWGNWIKFRLWWDEGTTHRNLIASHYIQKVHCRSSVAILFTISPHVTH